MEFSPWEKIAVDPVPVHGKAALAVQARHAKGVMRPVTTRGPPPIWLWAHEGVLSWAVPALKHMYFNAPEQ